MPLPTPPPSTAPCGRRPRSPLTASTSYWDRTPYVEVDDETGVVSYVEHHRTLGDWVSVLVCLVDGAGDRGGSRCLLKQQRSVDG